MNTKQLWSKVENELAGLHENEVGVGQRYVDRLELDEDGKFRVWTYQKKRCECKVFIEYPYTYWFDSKEKKMLKIILAAIRHTRKHHGDEKTCELLATSKKRLGL